MNPIISFILILVGIILFFDSPNIPQEIHPWFYLVGLVFILSGIYFLIFPSKRTKVHEESFSPSFQSKGASEPKPNDSTPHAEE